MALGEFPWRRFPGELSREYPWRFLLGEAPGEVFRELKEFQGHPQGDPWKAPWVILVDGNGLSFRIELGIMN
ncbi:MAG: hypothetical protein V1850_06010 [Candidatus Bathyarchaeota archaeon]